MNVRQAEELLEEWYQQGHLAYEICKCQTEVYRADCLNGLLEEHEQELANVKKEVEELREYKTMWQSIAGKANLKHMVQELKDAREVVGFYGDLHRYSHLDIEKDQQEYHVKDTWFMDDEDDLEKLGERIQWGVAVPKMYGGKRARAFLAKYPEREEG